MCACEACSSAPPAGPWSALQFVLTGARGPRPTVLVLGAELEGDIPWPRPACGPQTLQPSQRAPNLSLCNCRALSASQEPRYGGGLCAYFEGCGGEVSAPESGELLS